MLIRFSCQAEASALPLKYSGPALPVAIVCDTSPLSYLVLIGEVEMLPELYGEVWVPPAVEEELLHPEGPPEVREQVGSGPEWLKVKSLSEKSTSETSPSGDLLSELSGETAELVRDLGQGNGLRFSSPRGRRRPFL